MNAFPRRALVCLAAAALWPVVACDQAGGGPADPGPAHTADVTPDADVAPEVGAVDTTMDGPDFAEVDAGPELPQPAALRAYSGGQCPALGQGWNTITSGGIDRTVRMEMPGDPTEAPVLFLWYGLGDSATNFGNALAASSLAQDEGAIVVIAETLPAQGMMPAMWGFPSALGGDTEADLTLFDDLLACLEANYGVDNHRVYTFGFSAGAIWSSYLVLVRSEYLAAAAVFSGGVNPPEDPQVVTFLYETPDHTTPVIMGHGGPGDLYDAVVVQLHFDQMTEAFASQLAADGHFTVVCRHGAGHTITPQVGLAGKRFLFDRSFGMDPDPYAGGLPTDFASDCGIF